LQEWLSANTERAQRGRSTERTRSVSRQEECAHKPETATRIPQAYPVENYYMGHLEKEPKEKRNITPVISVMSAQGSARAWL